MYKGIVITPPDLNGCDWPGHMEELGLNVLGIHSGGGPSHRVLPALADTVDGTFRSKCAASRIEVEYELHAAMDLMPRELFPEHPEYFVQDFRSSRRNPAGNWCGVPDALSVVGKNAAVLAERLQPSTHRYFFWGSDEIGGWCHCDTCADFSAAEQSLLAANAMATSVRKVDPAGEVAFLAYCRTLERPRRVRPRDNVFLEFAPIERCFRHAIDDPGCSENRRLWRGLQELLEVFDPARTHILEYWLDSSLFSGWRKPAKAPEVEADVMWRDLQAYHRLGIRSFTTFAVYMDGEYFDRHGDRLLRQYAEMLDQLEPEKKEPTREV